MAFFHSQARRHMMRPNKNRSVSGNGSEKFRQGRHPHFLYYLFTGNFLCALKGILPFKMHKIIYIYSGNL